jgi:hypothetical protein
MAWTLATLTGSLILTENTTIYQRDIPHPEPVISLGDFSLALIVHDANKARELAGQLNKAADTRERMFNREQAQAESRQEAGPES